MVWERRKRSWRIGVQPGFVEEYCWKGGSRVGGEGHVEKDKEMEEARWKG